MTKCTYCGSTTWETRNGVVICEQCGFTPAEAAAEDARHRQTSDGIDPDALRDAEQRRRVAKVIEAGEGMPMRERLRAATRLLHEGAALSAELWEPQFATWKRETTTRLLESERRAG